ncbi:serine/threonine protein kinase [Streptomyces sp. NBC_01476]|uniref:serine/threonine-protein kinase n=1 Tax=Streptomyces sp. NBC_01476 TaxID=2903881 RepID=UPI002E381C30|nr:serine/threonine-protein kinase [Streptomyces sp. NBC_01476]
MPGGADGVPGGIGVGAVLGGRYRLDEALGAGGFGQVYAAFDENLGQPVAVKVLTTRPQWTPAERAEHADGFRREATAAAGLRHTNVAAVHGTGDHEGHPFIVMELLRGTDLGQVLLERGALPVAEVLSYGAQVSAGLWHAHEHGLVHRDIKPENLMLLPGGVVKICDFGLAARRDFPGARDTGPRAVLGSPPYLSPEQVQGLEITGQSDLYSLGCVLYALLAEGPPFAADTYQGYASLHVHQTPERIEVRRPEVPGDLAHLVHRMLAKDPRERPGNAGETADRLRTMLDGLRVPRAPRTLDQDTLHAVWTLLEEAEGLLSAGRFTEADARYWQVLQQLAGQGAEREAASFAALFGRARALEGRGGVAVAARRLAELARAAAAGLGAEHPLARCLASYAAVRAAHVR